jgi:thiol:disulfide interchange protein
MTPDLTIIGLWAAWLVSWGVAASWSNRTEKRGGIVAEIAFRILFYAGAILLLAPLSNRHYYAQVQFGHFSAALKWILVALTATGFCSPGGRAFTWGAFGRTG